VLRVERTSIHAAVREDEGEDQSGDPITYQFSSNVSAFVKMCGFSPADFAVLFEPLEPILTVPHRGRPTVIGARDAFFLFLHWLRSGRSYAQIAAGLHLSQSTLSKRVVEVAHAVHGPLVERFIVSVANTPFAARERFPECGMVVDATVQDRGRPVGRYDEAQRYFSGKHHCYCLKSQVITDRQGAAVLVASGVPGAMHDMFLFREHTGELIELIHRHAGEPVTILADKGYIGNSGSPEVALVTPHRKPPLRVLTPEQQQDNAEIGSERVIIENFFGRMRTKFHITSGRWPHKEEFYPIVFEICCALVNFDIRSPGGSPLRADDGQYYLQSVSMEIELAVQRERARQHIREESTRRFMEHMMRESRRGLPGLHPTTSSEEGDP
jgi:hypothetical protein